MRYLQVLVLLCVVNLEYLGEDDQQFCFGEYLSNIQVESLLGDILDALQELNLQDPVLDFSDLGNVSIDFVGLNKMNNQIIPVSYQVFPALHT